MLRSDDVRVGIFLKVIKKQQKQENQNLIYNDDNKTDMGKTRKTNAEIHGNSQRRSPLDYCHGKILEYFRHLLQK